MLHEGLVALLRERPTLVLELLRGPLGPFVPPGATVHVEDAALSQVVPPERRADLVLRVVEGAGATALGLVVEVQLTEDRRKRFTWPLYAAGLHARLEAPTCLVVVSPDPAIAAWARKPIVSIQPGSPFTPIVVGPEGVPRVIDEEEARRAPELAVLSALAHANAPDGLDVVLAALAGLADLDGEHASIYGDVIRTVLGTATRRALEEIVQLRRIPNYVFQDEVTKKNIALGIEEGLARGKAQALLAFLEARGLAASPEERERIASCTDSGLLDVWIRRAATARSMTEVLD